MNEFYRRFMVPAGFIAAVCGGGLTSAVAQPSETEAVEAAIACRNITEDLKRLACLDAATETLAVTRIVRKEAIEEQKREERTFFGLGKRKDKSGDDPMVTETPEEFGSEALLETRKVKEQRQLKQITSKIVGFNVNRYGKVTLTLENGQIWRQLNSDGEKLILFKKRTYTARVKRGLVGSYMLRVNELKRTVRVRRIK